MHGSHGRVAAAEGHAGEAHVQKEKPIDRELLHVVTVSSEYRPFLRGKWVLISISLVLVAIAAGALSHLRQAPAQATAPAVTVPEKSAQTSEVSLAGK